MNVAEFMLSQGQDEAAALLYRDSVLNYRELRSRVARLAAGLVERGYGQGTRIGIWAENSPFFVTAYLGLIRAGLVAVPLQTDLVQDTFEQIVAEAGLAAVFVSQRLLNRLRPWLERVRLTALSETDLPALMGQGSVRLPDIDARRDLAALMFTSGSTGAPKGVMVSHRNIECNARDIVAYMRLTSADRAMVVLPFHYCFGASLLHTHLLAGGSLVLNNEFRLYPEMVLREMQQKQCTGLAGVPSTYQLLLRKSRFCQLSFPGLRWFQQAGGKLPNACIAELLKAFPHVRYFLMYGQTEGTARLSFLPPERLQDKLGSIGRGLPSTRLEVLKPDGSPVMPGSAETGEIVASGDNISLGYWNDSVETARFFKQGRLYTGDIARVDADGFIFVVERERDMIKSGGNRVSAKEIEDVIAELPDVVEVAVLGTPHELLGEAIQAFVVPGHDRLTAQAVAAHCQKRLPTFKLPENVFFLDRLPHNSSGKVLKPKLKEQFLNRSGAPSSPAGLVASVAVALGTSV